MDAFNKSLMGPMNANQGKGSNDECYYYRKGGCRYGDECWFRHVQRPWDTDLRQGNDNNNDNMKNSAKMSTNQQCLDDVPASDDEDPEYDGKQSNDASNCEDFADDMMESIYDEEEDMFNSESFNPNDYFFSSHDMYKKDDPSPDIVVAARSGNLSQIKQYIANGVDLDKRKRWTEVEEKYGYDKSWEWFGDSALIAAARNGHVEIVEALLLGQADPMLKSCPTDDECVCAMDVAKNEQIRQMIGIVLQLWTQLNPNCNESAHYKKNKQVKNKPSKESIRNALSDSCNN